MSTIRHGTYIGTEYRLIGKTALIMDDPESTTRGVLAQFNDKTLKEAFRWWSFYSYEFRLKEEEECEL